MAKSLTRDEFKNKCMRALGAPVINIEVTDDQIDDCVDNAIQYWADYHFDGAERIFYKHQISDADKVNGYIILPDNILGAVRVFPIDDPSISSDSLFNIRYQIALNDLYTLTSSSIVPYYMAMQHLSLLTEVLVGQKPYRYNRHSQKLSIDMEWSTINTGTYLLVEADQVMDPETNESAWNDRWLYEYCTALIKKQWGTNTKKFIGTTLPGGIQFNGQQIYDEADNDIKMLREQMANDYSLPPQGLMG